MAASAALPRQRRQGGGAGGSRVFLSSIAFNAFGDMLTGTQQIVSTQVFLTISILAEFALIVWLVGAGRGIRGLAEAYLARVAINDGLTWWWAHRTIKWLRLSPRRVHRESLRYVVHFGGLVQLQSMLAIFQVSVDRLAALTLIDVSAAGLLDVAKKWPTALSSIPTAFLPPLLPAASHVDAASERSRCSEHAGSLSEERALFESLYGRFFIGHGLLVSTYHARLVRSGVTDEDSLIPCLWYSVLRCSSTC